MGHVYFCPVTPSNSIVRGGDLVVASSQGSPPTLAENQFKVFKARYKSEALAESQSQQIGKAIHPNKQAVSIPFFIRSQIHCAKAPHPRMLWQRTSSQLASMPALQKTPPVCQLAPMPQCRPQCRPHRLAMGTRGIWG